MTLNQNKNLYISLHNKHAHFLLGIPSPKNPSSSHFWKTKLVFRYPLSSLAITINPHNAAERLTNPRHLHRGLHQRLRRQFLCPVRLEDHPVGLGYVVRHHPKAAMERPFVRGATLVLTRLRTTY